MRIGRWSINHPKSAIVAWLVFVVGCLTLGAITGTKTLDNGAVGESARGYAIMNRDQLWPPPRELAYIQDARAPLSELTVGDLERRFRIFGLKPQRRVSLDGRSALVAANVNSESDVVHIQSAVAAAARAHPGLTIEETGDISADQARSRAVDRDLHRAELLSIPVTLVILLFAFRAAAAAVVPVLLALSAVAAGLGLLGPLSQVFPVEDSAKTVVLLIGMAVGVDYALFFIVRSRTERHRGSTTTAALETTLRTSGRAVLISGATVAIAMAGMYLVGVATLSGIATAAISVIACAVLASLTALPAILRILGPRIDRGRIPLLARAQTEGSGRFWASLVERVTRRPMVATLVSTAALVALAYPALSLHLAKPSDLALSDQSEPGLKALADVRRGFPSAGESAIIAVEALVPQGGLQDELRLLSQLAVRDGIAHPPVDPIKTRSTRAGSAGALFLPLTGNGANSSSRHAVDALRQQVIPDTLGRLSGATTAVTGVTAEDVDFTRQIEHALPYVLGFVLTLAFGLLLLAFRSIIVPLKAIALNLLSVAAAYGTLALVFEHHWAESILSFHSNGSIVSWLPLFLFVVLFGISMDYHVFILSRVREAVDHGEPTRSAVKHSIGATAGVVTAAAVVMVGVFSLFGTLSSLELKQAGVGLAAAVLIDATIIRGVLLPATMTLLGERNWYLPRRLSWLPSMSHETTAPASVSGAHGSTDAAQIPRPFTHEPARGRPATESEA